MKFSISYVIVIITLLAFLINPFVPVYIKSLAYSVSLTLKEFITFIIPLIIFSFLFRLIERLRLDAVKLLIFFMITVLCANTVSISTANIIAREFIPMMNLGNLSEYMVGNDTLLPIWDLAFPKLMPMQYVMVVSILSAAIMNYINKNLTTKISKVLTVVAEFLLRKVILPLIPLFIVGSVFKIGHDGILIPIIKNYYVILLMIVFSAWTYLLFWYLVITKKDFITAIKNMIPTLITGFSTMSSNISLPVLIESIKKNTKGKPSIVDSVLPTAINFHLVGDAFVISILSTSIFYSFNGFLPTLSDQLIFVVYFIFMKFAMAAVPGGGAIVMMPIMQSVYHFNAEMISLMITMYIIFDPINTVTNLLGNGAFMLGFRKLFASKFEEHK